MQVLKMSSIFSHRRVIVRYNKDIFGCVCTLLSGKIRRRARKPLQGNVIGISAADILFGEFL